MTTTKPLTAVGTDDTHLADEAAFAAAMQGVKRLNTRPKASQALPKKPLRRRSEPSANPQEIDCSSWSDFEKHALLTSDDRVEYQQTGLQHKILRKMRSGQYNVEAVLDLHGMTADQAKVTLAQFITQCLQQGVKYVLIIHGKGRNFSQPVLKNKLNHWLRQIHSVLAFCSAGKERGQGGAMVVLLKHQQGEIVF